MKRSSSVSRLPLSRARASSTSRASSSNQLNTPSLRRSKSSLSLKRTPQSVQSVSVKAKKREVRPIQDKTWQATALERTQHYFQQNPEARQLLNKGVSIRPITLKMFVQLTNIVLKNIDSNFDELTVSNYVELLPMHLNTLMYPGVITPSTLKTANAMHSWPHILAILAWLVELHELSMMVAVEETILDVPPNAPFEVQTKKSEIKIMLEFFQQFNNGKETDENQDKIIIERMYKKMCNFYDDDYENFSKKLHKLQEELRNAEEILDSDQQVFMNLEDEHSTSVDKLKHINDSIENEKQLIEDLKRTKSEFLRDIDNIKRNISKTEISIKNLKENINNQPMTLLQRTHALKEIDDLKRQIELLKKENGHQFSLKDEIDNELSELKQQMEEIISNYNIELMRPSLKHPELNKIALPQEKLLLQSAVKEVISKNIEMKEKLLNDLELKIRQTQDVFTTIKYQKESKQQNVDDNKLKIQEKNNKHEMLKNQFEELTTSQQQIEIQHKNKINKLQEKLQLLKEVNPNVEHKLEQMKITKNNCDELKNKLFKKQAEMYKFFEKIEQEIRINQVPKYKEINKGIIEKVDAAVMQYSNPPAMLNKIK